MAANKRSVGRLVEEVWNQYRLEPVDELYASTVVTDYRPCAPLRQARDAVRAMVEVAWVTLPGYHDDLLGLVAEDDRVTVHLGKFSFRGPGTLLRHWRAGTPARPHPVSAAMRLSSSRISDRPRDIRHPVGGEFERRHDRLSLRGLGHADETRSPSPGRPTDGVGRLAGPNRCRGHWQRRPTRSQQCGLITNWWRGTACTLTPTGWTTTRTPRRRTGDRVRTGRERRGPRTRHRMHRWSVHGWPTVSPHLRYERQEGAIAKFAACRLPRARPCQAPRPTDRFGARRVGRRDGDG